MHPCLDYVDLQENTHLFPSHSQIKVYCVTVSTAPVKGTIDDHIQRLFDALLSSLRRSITESVTEIEKFLKEGMETLGTMPQTVEEIGNANAKHAELEAKKPEVSLIISLMPMYSFGKL